MKTLVARWHSWIKKHPRLLMRSLFVLMFVLPALISIASYVFANGLISKIGIVTAIVWFLVSVVVEICSIVDFSISLIKELPQDLSTRQNPRLKMTHGSPKRAA